MSDLDILHGQDIKNARRCVRLNGVACDICKPQIAQYQREMREKNPSWNKKANVTARRRRKAMVILMWRHTKEFEDILQDVIFKEENGFA